MEEIWKTIKKYPDYEVSNLGRIKSHKRKTEHILSPGTYSNGYLFVTLSNEEGHRSESIHRLVLETFNPVENMENLQVNHINCNRADNRLDNLEWMTANENRKYRDKIKHTPKAQTILVQFLDEREDMIFNSLTACGEYIGITLKVINRYLETQNIRSDRKVQAHFYLLGNTYDLNPYSKK